MALNNECVLEYNVQSIHNLIANASGLRSVLVRG